jgi:hypothetical protein
MFRPVVCWLAVSSFLFLWQYHRAQASKAVMQFTVVTEKGEELVLANTTLNGDRYLPGFPCGIGWKKLVVQAENVEPFETNCFVWYSGEAFGNITLARSRGRMDLDLSPAVKTVQIVGTEERKTFTNVTHESLALPTGQYTVKAGFARFSVERTVDVARNQTTRVAIAPSLTTLNLSSDPEEAEFELTSTKPPEVSVRGSTPAMLTDLPAGEYQLGIARGGYRKNLPVRLTESKATNELKIEFRYAKLSVTSDPADATISGGTKVFGRTPASLDLQPGLYHFQIVKDGYFATNVSFTLLESDSKTVSVGLTSISFVEAMESARRQSSGLLVDYDRALADVEKALLIKSNDPTAQQLKQAIKFNWHIRNAKQFQRNQEYPQALFEVEAALKVNADDTDARALKAEVERSQRASEEEKAKAQVAAATARAEERRKHPEKVIREFTKRFAHQELFDIQFMRFGGSLDSVRTGIIRALGRNPEWSIVRDDRPDPDTVLMIANHSGFGSKQNVTIVATQSADNEVVGCFKLFAFVLGDIKIGLGGISEDSYKPKHPRYFPTALASTVEGNLSRDTQAFKKRLEEEIR